jgi:hypothetical protein
MIKYWKAFMHRLFNSRLFLFVLTFFILFSSGTAVFAQTVVAPLPDNNLVQNPWFREGDKSSLSGWTDAAGTNAIWSLSQKRSNPGPDQVWGTSARLAFGYGQGGGVGQEGVDAYLYQVVTADSSLNHLRFKIHWVTQWIERAAVTIYGGNSADGPWTAVWVPFEVDQSTSSFGAWTQTELLDTTIPDGFPYYKVELFGRYPIGGRQGVKYTGVYFSVDDNAGPVATPLPNDPTQTSPDPTLVPAEETVISPTNTPIPELDERMEPESIVSAVTRPAQPTRSAPQANTQDTAVNPTPPLDNSISPVSLLIIGILLLFVIVLGIGWARAARR